MLNSKLLSFYHDISFVEPSNNKIDDSSKNGSQSIMLLDTAYKYDIFNFIPRLFTITTRNGSSNFNTEMLLDSSSVISNELKLDHKINVFHLDIADEENVLEKFSQLFQGKTVTFTDEDLPISYKIVRSLHLLNCPNFMKPYDLQSKSTTPMYDQEETENEAVINFSDFNDFLSHKSQSFFTIYTNKNSYKCRLYAVYSSRVIRDFLKTNPDANQYKYQFDDSNGEFEMICKLFNFQKITIARDNIEILNKITEDLQITDLVEPLKKFVKNYDKISEQFNQQQFDQFEEIVDRLYNLNEQNIIETRDKILENKNFENEEDVAELVSYILHVIKTDDSHNDELFELLDSIVKNCNDNSPLKQLINHIITRLLYLLGINKSVCAFTYKLYQHGYIQKVDLFDSINEIYNDNFKQFKHYCCPYKYYGSNNIESEKSNGDFIYDDENKDFMTSTIYDNLNCWFLPELIEMKLYGKLNSLTNSKKADNNDIFFTGKNLFNKMPSEQFQTKNYFNQFLPDKLDLYEQLRKSFNSCDDLTFALRNDDVDKLKSILTTQQHVPFNIYDDYINNDCIIDYAAAYGSFKCFNYLLSNNHITSFRTLELSVYGSNLDIIKIMFDLQKKAKLLQHRAIDFSSFFALAIAKHRNDIFDFLLDQQLKKKSFTKYQDIYDFILKMSCKCGNLHSLIQIIKKGYDFSNEFSRLANIAAANGFYKIVKLLCQLNKDIKPSIIILKKASIKKQYEYFFPALMFENLLFFKLFPTNLFRFNSSIFEYFVYRGFKSSIKYYLENFKKLISYRFIIECLSDALCLKKKDIFIFLFEQIKINYPKEIKNLNSIWTILDSACTMNKIEAAKAIIQFIISLNPKYDFSTYFLKAVASNSIEICKYIIDSKLFINYLNIVDNFISIKNVNEETFTFFINNIPADIKQMFINDYLSTAISSSNIHLIEYLLKEKIDSSNSLIDAAKTGNIDIVNIVLKYIDPIFINNNSENGTALCIACRNSSIEIVRRLLSVENINLNLSGNDNLTPLNIAVNEIKIDIINLILDFYGDNLKNEIEQLNKSLVLILNRISFKRIKNTYANGNKGKLIPIIKRIIKVENVDLNCYTGDYSLLSFASEINDKEVVEFLLKSKKVNVNLTGPNTGNTALMNSIEFKNFDITKMLLEDENIDINISNYQNKTPLIIAVENESIEIIDLLINHSNFNAKKSLLAYAFYISTPKISKKLITLKSLDVNYVARDMKKISTFSKISDLCTTKLIEAASIGPNEEMIDLIIHHPSFDKEKSLAKLALFKSISTKENIEISKKILALFDNDVNIINEDGNSLLSSAIQFKNYPLVTYILDNPKFRCNENEIIDLFRISLMYPELQQLILKYAEENRDSIDFNCKSKAGNTIFTGIIFQLISKANNYEYNESLYKPIKCKMYVNDLIKFLIDNGTDPNIPDSNGNYPLELCMKYNNSNQIIKYLYNALIESKKIDFSTKIYDRVIKECYTTYLHLAINTNSSQIDKLISDESIDINVTDSNGNTPLMIACKNRMDKAILLLFKRDDLDYLHRNNEGKDALMIYYPNNDVYESIQNKDEYLKKIIQNDKYEKINVNDKEFIFSFMDQKLNTKSGFKAPDQSSDKPKFEIFHSKSKPASNEKFKFALPSIIDSSSTSGPNNEQQKKTFSFGNSKEKSELKTSDQNSKTKFSFSFERSKPNSETNDESAKEKFKLNFNKVPNSFSFSDKNKSSSTSGPDNEQQKKTSNFTNSKEKSELKTSDDNSKPKFSFSFERSKPNSETNDESAKEKFKLNFNKAPNSFSFSEKNKSSSTSGPDNEQQKKTSNFTNSKEKSELKTSDDNSKPKFSFSFERSKPNSETNDENTKEKFKLNFNKAPNSFSFSNNNNSSSTSGPDNEQQKIKFNFKSSKEKAESKTSDESPKPKFDSLNEKSETNSETKNQETKEKFKLDFDNSKSKQNSETNDESTKEKFKLNFNKAPNSFSFSNNNNSSSTSGPNNEQQKKTFNFSNSKEKSELKTSDDNSKPKFTFNFKKK